jgi:bacterioferritin-associated ferredoxin
MYICLCNAITEREIRACAEEGACTLGDLEHRLGLGAGCGRCKHLAREVLNDTRPEPQAVLAGASA